MATEAHTHAARQRAQGFGRDLLVNVLGNLITAAIIYLGAVVGGYLARNDALLVASLVLVAIGIYPVVTTALEHYFPASTAVTNRWWFGALTGMVVALLLVVAIGLWVVG